jgi:peptide/nickel transport system substrate-binding protein
MATNTAVPAFTKKAQKGALFLSLLVVFGMVLSACGGASGGGSKANPNAPLTIQNGPVGDYTQNFSPFSPSPDPGTDGMVYETLLMFNQLDGSVQPWLASSYQMSSDAKTITFTIRQGVKWSDGEAFTPADVAFTFNMLKQYPDADLGGLWAELNSVTVNGNNVVFTLKKPDSSILWNLAGQTYIVPQHIFSKIGDPAKYINAKPVGTGPYTLDNFTPQLIAYKKNPNYWQPGKPQVNELHYVAYDSNQSVELDLDQGNLDWVGLFTPNVQKTYVARDPAHYHYYAPSNSPTVLYMNLAKAPFNQLAVRQAILDSLDLQQMSTNAESGYDPPASQTGLVLPNQQSYLAPQYANLTHTVDTAKAISLLKGAGFTQGANGIFKDSSGKQLSFNIDVVTGWTDWVAMAQIIAANLKAIGINATTNAIAQPSYVAALQNGNYDMGIGSIAAGPTPYYFFNELLNSKFTRPIGQAAAPNANDERWMDSKTDTLLAQFAGSADPNVQKQAIQGLEQIMVNQVPAIPLVNASFLTEYSSKNFTGWPDQSNAYAAPDPWAAPAAENVVLHLKPAA